LKHAFFLLRAITTLAPVDPLPLPQVAKLILDGCLDEVLEKVVGAFEDSTKGVRNANPQAG
jgi:hypothetical protein